MKSEFWRFLFFDGKQKYCF